MSAFDGRVALVTGGGSGIGRASALAFARKGAAVTMVDIDEQSGAATVGQIEDSGGRAMFLPADVTVAGQAEAMVAGAISAFGRLDLAHNNAGITGPGARRPTTPRPTGPGHSRQPEERVPVDEVRAP